jgi:hypothetical protein
MAKGRGGRGPSRMDKRREAEAVEAKEAREQEDGQEEEVEESEEEEADSDAGDAEGDDGDEEGGKKKKAPKKKAPKKPAAPTKRSRAAKEVRRRAVWKIYDNASKVIETFPFNQKAEAEAFLAKKIEEKKGTFYLNVVKEEIVD